MKRIRGMLLIYALVFVLFTLIFITLFHTPFYSTQMVLFYRGIALLFLSILFTLLFIMLICKKWLKLYIESVIAALIVSISINLSVFIVFPVTFERSVTMYLLGVLKQDSIRSVCQSPNNSKLTNSLINNYVINSDAVGKRINEQEIIGFVENQKGCTQLTTRGQRFLNLAEAIKKIYGLKE